MLVALAKLSPGDIVGRSPAQVLKTAGRSSLEVEVQKKAPGQPDAIFGRLRSDFRPSAARSTAAMSRSAISRILWRCASSPNTARSCAARGERSRLRPRDEPAHGRQPGPRRGGVGIGASLREVSEVDPRYGGFLNADLAEYVLPVNADIGSIDVEFIDKPDTTFNRPAPRDSARSR